jgi:hypothetical protein
MSVWTADLKGYQKEDQKEDQKEKTPRLYCGGLKDCMRVKIRALILGASIALVSIVFPIELRAQVAGDIVFVTVPSAAVYRAANESGKTTSFLKQGRRIHVSGPIVGGFVPTRTKSGATAWIRAADVAPEPRPEPKPAQDSDSILGFERLAVDVGAGRGSYGGASYSEINLGINGYVKSWWAWRNSVFARFPQRLDTVYGLDSSVRGILDLSPLIAFAGPGYRVANQSSSAPFVELGFVLKIAGISLGVGMKYLFDSFTNPGRQNDSESFIILAGGGAI